MTTSTAGPSSGIPRSPRAPSGISNGKTFGIKLTAAIRPERNTSPISTVITLSANPNDTMSVLEKVRNMFVKRYCLPENITEVSASPR